VKITEGTVVLSAAGHDKNRVFAVIGLSGGEIALIADGKLRKLEKPKKKKLKHLKLIGILEFENPPQTNRQLKKALMPFNAAGGQGEVLLLVKG
jgi:hypothetical protein